MSGAADVEEAVRIAAGIVKANSLGWYTLPDGLTLARAVLAMHARLATSVVVPRLPLDPEAERLVESMMKRTAPAAASRKLERADDIESRTAEAIAAWLLEGRYASRGEARDRVDCDVLVMLAELVRAGAWRKGGT